METPKVKHVVVDAIAFFKNVQLQDIADNVYTNRGVISEIRDSATRKRLAVLPYELKCKEPSTDALQIVSDFARKTGDYSSLSAVDLRVLALAYQITKENIGADHLFKHPDTKETQSSNLKPVQKPGAVVGFVYPKPAGKDTEQVKTGENVTEDNKLVEQLNQLNTNTEIPASTKTHTEGDIELTLTELETENQTGDTLSSHESDCTHQSSSVETKENTTSGLRTSEDQIEETGKTRQDEGEVKDVECDEEDRIVKENIEHDKEQIGPKEEAQQEDEEEDKDEEEEEEEEEDGEEEEDDGWITPANISQAHQTMGGADEEADDIEVGCMTTDFAMQNVLIQMGIPVLSVNGLRIRRAKSYILRCYGCFKTTTIMNKTFCPSCGNQSLSKVSVSLDDSGNQQLYFSKRKTLNKRGLKYSLPMPQGGKHAYNPFLVADQPMPQNRIPRKARIGTDVFDPDFNANSSPFAFKDVSSRSAKLGTGRLGAGSNRKNPNQLRKKTGKKK